MVRGRWLPQETLQSMLDDLATKYQVPKTIQLIAAGVLAIGALIYIAFIVRDIYIGRRRFGWDFAWGKIVRIVLLVAILAVWWIFWHTDIVLSHILGTLPDNAITVRMLIPADSLYLDFLGYYTLASDLACPNLCAKEGKNR